MMAFGAIDMCNRIHSSTTWLVLLSKILFLPNNLFFLFPFGCLSLALLVAFCVCQSPVCLSLADQLPANQLFVNCGQPGSKKTKHILIICELKKHRLRERGKGKFSLSKERDRRTGGFIS